MSKNDVTNRVKPYLKGFDGKIKELLLLTILALALIFAAWRIFRAEDAKETLAVEPTETEARVMRLLEEIDGVGEANVIIYETEDGIQSVAVVCDGANNLRVVMNVRSAVSAALGTDEKKIKVYLKKE